MSVKPIPEGYHSVTPYLIIRGAADAIEFYKKAFGAVELFRFPAPGGKIGHAEIKVGDSPIMLADEYPDMGYNGPQSIGGSPVSLMIYLEDVDSVFNRAVDAGAAVKEAVQDKFYGDRTATSGTSQRTKKMSRWMRWSGARKLRARVRRAAVNKIADTESASVDCPRGFLHQ